MSSKKTKTCSIHLDFRPISLAVPKPSQSYIENYELLENELGKGNTDWFLEASHRPYQCKQTSLCTVTPISKKCFEDLRGESSPVRNVPNIFDSQFSTTSPLAAWMPPSLGISPVTGTTQRYEDSQNELAKSLGVNDSTLSWTSSLATPNHADLDTEKDTPAETKKKGFSRMLFSPGICNINDSPVLNDSKTGILNKKCKPIEDRKTKNAERVEELTRQQINTNLFEQFSSCSVDSSTFHKTGPNAEHKIEPLADALSDFFDPPAKAAGRRRSAPSYRKRSDCDAHISIHSKAKSFSQEYICENEITDNQYKVKIENNNKILSQVQSKLNEETNSNFDSAEYFEHINSKNHDLCDLQSKVVPEDIIVNTETYMLKMQQNNTANDTVEVGEYSQAELFCSTPLDYNKSYKSILSTSKKKTHSSKKKVRFVQNLEVKILSAESISYESEPVAGLETKHIGTTSQINTTEDLDKNINDTDVGGYNKEGTEDLFSQVSPTALQEMCSISDKSVKSIQTSNETKCSLPTMHLPDIKTAKNRSISECCPTNLQTNASCTEKVNCSAQLEKPKLKKMAAGVGKQKRFLYPTNSQINTSCPSTVYGFKQQKIDIETSGKNSLDCNDTVKSGNQSDDTSLQTPLNSATKSDSQISATRSSKISDSSTELGFKRYNDLAKDSSYDSGKRSFTSSSLSVASSVARFSDNNICTTPISVKRNSFALKRKKLCLDKQNLKELESPIHELTLPSHNKQVTCIADDITASIMDKSPNEDQRSHVTCLTDVDMFDDISFEELSEEITRSEIMSDVVKNNSMEQSKHAVETVEQNVICIKNLKNANCKNKLFRGFQTASGSKIDITREKMLAAEKLFDSSECPIESKDYSVFNNNLLSVEETDDGKFSSSLNHVHTNILDVEVKIKQENTSMDNTFKLKVDNTEGKIHTKFDDEIKCTMDNYIQSPQKPEWDQLDSRSCTLSSVVNLDTEMKKENENSTIESMEIPGDFYNGGFSTAFGKGLKCTISSEIQANKLFVDSVAGVDIGADECRTINEDNNGSESIKGHNRVTQRVLKLNDMNAGKLNLENICTDTEKQKLSLDVKSVSGFSTSSGKGINLSASSLAKSEMLLIEYSAQHEEPVFNYNTNEDDTFIGTNRDIFAASDKRVSFPKQKLSKAPSLVTDHSEDQRSTAVKAGVQLDERLTGNIGFVGFSTASGKGITFTTASLSRAQGLMTDTGSEEGISKTNFLKDINNDIDKEGDSCCPFGIDQPTPCRSTTQNLLKDPTNQKEALNASYKVLKKDLFENLFNDLLNQNLQSSNEDNSTENNLETELENLLMSKKPNVIVNVPTKSSKTSRFPPGANIPQGFRPFKPPKIIKMQQSKEESSKLNSDQYESNILRSDKETKGLKNQTAVNNTSATSIADQVDFRCDHLDGALLEDVFSDDMLPSQKFSPESGHTAGKTGNITSELHGSDNVHSATGSDILSNIKHRISVTSLGQGGDINVNSHNDTQMKVDCKGDNSHLVLEMIMDPENEFTQMLQSDIQIPKADQHYLNPNNSGLPRNNIVKNNEHIESLSGICEKVSDKHIEHTTKAFKDENASPLQNIKDEFVSEKKIIYIGHDLIQPSISRTEKNRDCEQAPVQPIHSKTNLYESLINPFQSASGKSVSVSTKALNHARHSSLSQMTSVDHIPVCETADQHSKQTLVGSPFKSTSGNKILFSEKSLEHVKKTCTDDNSSPFQSASGNKISISEKSLQQARKTLMDDNSSPFQSASGNKISISEKSLEQARKILMDDNSSPFQSASGNKISISEKSLQQARKTLMDDNSSPFQSASGNKISISEKSLEHARKTLMEDNSSPFQCASGNKISLSKKSLEHARKTLMDDNSSPFQSASGNKISISEKSLEHAKKTLMDGHSSPFQSASGNKISISEKSLEHARKTLMDDNSNSFQCASGNKISLSEKSLEHTRKTLMDDNSDPFQSASGNKISISEKYLQHARKTLMDDNSSSFQCASGNKISLSEKSLEHATRTSMDDNSSPFQSASGNKISISEKSLQHARKTLMDDNSSPFQSASGNKISISEKSLEHARKTLMDDNSSTFQSASGSCITVSKNDLEQSVKSLTEINSTCSSKDDKLYTDNKSNTLDQYEITFSDNIKTNSQKRKRSDFEDDFDVPLEVLEQMEQYGKQPKIDNEGSKLPLSTIPEDYSKDRQISGFSPKPLKSQSAESHLSKKYLDNQSRETPCVIPKSSFKTPYKPSVGSDSLHTAQPVNKKIKTVAPVFVPKTSETKITGNSTNDEQNSVALPSKLNRDQSVLKNNYDNKVTLNMSGSKELDKACMKINQETKELIQKARSAQSVKIQQNMKEKVVPVEGRLYQMKQSKRRLKLRDFISVDRKWVSDKFHMHPSTKEVRCGNAALHRFYIPDFYGLSAHHLLVGDGAFLVPDDTGYAGRQEFYQAFLTIEGVDSNLLDEKWFYNHYRWVVWKLASYEVASPQHFAGRCLTPEVVMLQMKYRYDREIDKCQRSSIMKICERDDTPCKRMVLCVSDIRYVGSNKEPQITLTDGWYSINAKVDGPLANLINKGRIQIGQKLCMSGSELIGSQDACPPLQAPESLMLKINSNSTRPATWDSRLGYQTDHTPLCVPLSSLHGEGGLVGCIDVIVVRKYPTMYMEKLPGGGCIFRSSTAEEKYKQSYHQIQQDRMEKIYLQLEGELEKDDRAERCIKRKKWSKKDIEQLNTGQEIYEAINSSTHPDDLQTYLSTNQLELLMDHQRTVQDEKRQKLNSDFQKAWNDKEENNKARNVVPLMKIRIVGCCTKDTDSQLSSLLTIWRPTSAHTDLGEGKRYKIYSLAASNVRSRSTHSGVQLTATKQTHFKPLSLDDNILDLVYEPREVSTKQEMTKKKPAYGEADIVGIVIAITSTQLENSGKQQDHVYIADNNDDLIGIKFWGGIKLNGLSDVLQEGGICCCSNLCDKSSYPSTYLPMLEFSPELSVISTTPQHTAQRKHMEKLKVKLKEKPDYLKNLKQRLDDKLNRRNVLTVSRSSPEKMDNISDLNLSNCQTPILKPSSKMAALLSYPSPSPLSPIVLSSSKSIHKAFKPPSLLRK